LNFFPPRGANEVPPHCDRGFTVERIRMRKKMEEQLSLALEKVVAEAEKTDHIPSITTNEANPFPYQVPNLFAGLM
jgi:hypothetical protein